MVKIAEEREFLQIFKEKISSLYANASQKL